MSSKAEAREFSDVWGEFIHSGRWYRSVTLLLAAANVVLLFLVVVIASEPDPLPLVVRVDEVGRAEVVDYRLERAEVDQNSPVVGFFLNQFVVDHYSRRHALRADRWERSLVFLTPQLQQEAYTRDVDELSAFLSDPSIPELLIQDIVVRVIPQPEPPYRAEVLFERVEVFGGSEISREQLTLSLQFVFAENVSSDAMLINPMGLVVVFMDMQRQLVGVGDLEGR